VFGTGTVSILTSTVDSQMVDSTIVAALAGAVAGLVSSVFVFYLRFRVERRTELVSQFSDALTVALAWVEFVYVIRRREAGADSRERIRSEMNAVQQKLAYHENWLRIDNRKIYETYSNLVRKIKRETIEAMRAGWDGPPVSSDSDMNIEGDIQHPSYQAEADAYVAEVKSFLSGYIWKLWR
jgi:hypothetical protein